jgi:aspartyl/asparaginyl beta-hydroxylase (cupin superfamily)
MNKVIVTIILMIFILIYYVTNIDGYDLLDYINYVNNQYCENKAYHDTKNIDWCIKLRNNWKIIRDEYIDYCKKYELKRFKDIDDNQKNFDIGEKGWYVAFLKVYGSYTKLIKVFPNTYNLIKNIPGCTLAMFSTIDAGKLISDHYGPYNGVLRYHLCLITDKENPEKCYIVVNYIKYYWKEGKDVLFDDFMAHCVNNDTKSTRVVLFLDIKKEFNNLFINYLNSLFLLVGSKNITKEAIVNKTNSII